MKRAYENLCVELKVSPKTWLVTGVAGFIGSNLLETLLRLDQQVVGLDNFSTGYQRNLNEVERLVSEGRWRNFTFVEGDIRNLATCRQVCENVDYVLHQAALGSVPLSVDDPLIANENNITGFLNMLVAARDAKVKRFVYAASSATYGDQADLPKIEEKIGTPLSPYAVTKLANELYAAVFAKTYGFKSIGLRYFNIFGQRQDPNGAYAAVIPKWFGELIKGERIYINGDGETSRDFCFVDNAVQANLLAATVNEDNALNQIYNVAVGERTSLNDLFTMIQHRVAGHCPEALQIKSSYREFRAGDVRHSQADITKARKMLGYQPDYSVGEGLDKAAGWYLENLR